MKKLLLALIYISSTLSAAELKDSFQKALYYNLFARESVESSSGEVSGAIFAGTDLKLDNYRVGHGLADAKQCAISVLGKLSLHYPSVTYSGLICLGKEQLFWDKYSLYNAAQVEGWQQVIADLGKISQRFYDARVTGKFARAEDRFLIIDATAAEAEHTTVRLAADKDLAGIEKLIIRANRGHKVLVNISGAEVNLPNFTLQLEKGISPEQVVVNFSAAEKISLGKIDYQKRIEDKWVSITKEEFNKLLQSTDPDYQIGRKLRIVRIGFDFEGHLIAPKAEVVAVNGVFEGKVIVRTFRALERSVEFHDRPYLGVNLLIE